MEESRVARLQQAKLAPCRAARARHQVSRLAQRQPVPFPLERALLERALLERALLERAPLVTGR